MRPWDRFRRRWGLGLPWPRGHTDFVSEISTWHTVLASPYMRLPRSPVEFRIEFDACQTGSPSDVIESLAKHVTLMERIFII